MILSYLLDIFLISIWAKDVLHVPQTTFRSCLQCNSNQGNASQSSCSGLLYWISKCLLCHWRCNTQRILCSVTWQRHGLEGKMIHPFLMLWWWEVASPAYVVTDAYLVTTGTHAIGWWQTQKSDHLWIIAQTLHLLDLISDIIPDLCAVWTLLYRPGY